MKFPQNFRGLNKRPKSKGIYLSDEDLYTTLEEAYFQALNKASLEVSEGIYDSKQL